MEYLFQHTTAAPERKFRGYALKFNSIAAGEDSTVNHLLCNFYRTIMVYADFGNYKNRIIITYTPIPHLNNSFVNIVAPLNCYQIVNPPSTTRLAPVIYLDASLAKKQVTLYSQLALPFCQAVYA